MCCIFKNFFLLILSSLLNNCEVSFSACATYHSWLLRCLSYCLSSKHKPCYVLSCFVWRPFLPTDHPGCLSLCCSCCFESLSCFNTRWLLLHILHDKLCFDLLGMSGFLFWSVTVGWFLCKVHKQKAPFATSSDGPLFLPFWEWGFCLCILFFLTRDVLE